LQITEEASNKYKQIDIEISTAPAQATNENVQTVISKSIILDSGWFDGDQTKFENWWREIQ